MEDTLENGQHCQAPIAGQRLNGRACTHCHQRKVRCDILNRGAPCTNCISRQGLKCQLYEKKRYRNRAHRNSASPNVERPIHPKGVSLDSPLSNGASTAKQSGPTDDGDEDEAGNLTDLINREDVRNADIGHRGRMCYVGTSVSNFHHLVQQTTREPFHSNLFHFGTRQFNRKYTAHDLQRVPPEALQRLSTAMEEKLLRIYFERINTGWPIIDEKYFMKQYEETDSQNPLPLPLLNAILLVGAHTLAATDHSVRSLIPTLFRRAKILIEYRYEQDRTLYVQAALLMTWYSDGHEEVLANAWYWIGFAARVAIGQGMHRDATHSKMLPEHKRTWTRLWWILFQFDVIVSVAYGRPQVLNIEESDVPDLEPAHFEGIPRAEFQFVKHHTKLCVIISRIMKTRWALRSSVESRMEASRQADKALACFTLELPEAHNLSFSNLSPWTATLHLTYNNFLILLHRSPPANNRPDPVADACKDASVCSNATILIASILETLRHRKALSSLWLYSVHCLFTATIYASNELRSGNPLVSAKATRTFESLIESLKVLSFNWQFARSVLCLFQQNADTGRVNSRAIPTATASRLTGGGGEDVAVNRSESFPLPALNSQQSVNISETQTWSDRNDDDINRSNYDALDMGKVRGNFGVTDPSHQWSSTDHNAVSDTDYFPNILALELFLTGMEPGLQQF